MTGASTLSATNCSIYVASTANDAVEIYGTSSISANRVIINGTYVDPAGTSISPAPVTGTVTDPLANLPAPTFSGCNYTDAWYYNGATATLNPGVYCGGITASDATLTLNPGTYILNGDGLIVENSGSITGSGVFFYNTGVNGQIAGPVTITGSGAVNLSAPTSGTYEGILFFQDRSVTYTTANSVSNAGGGTMTGTFYFPTTAFTFAGSSAVSIYDAFVVNTLTITGASYLKQDTTGTYTGLTQSSAALIQ
jgi:hypothetical protein